MDGRISDPAAYRAALYIRLSKEDESDGPSQSVTNQQSLLSQFASEQRLTVHDVYIDDGWSGTSFDRPAFLRMIGDIEAKKVNLVVTKDLSRLGRDYILTGHYLERYFPEHRVRYISLLDGVDTGVDSAANDITPFRAIMNDMYAKDISKKITSVKRDKQRKGLFIGGKPVYGYRMHPTEKNKIVIDEAAAAVVRRIFAMALEGISCRQIAARLNEARVPPPAVYAGLTQARQGAYAGLWSSERVSALLQNETYIGNMVQGRSVKVSYKTKKRLHQDAKDWIVVENTHEPLIDRDAFDRVRRLIASRKRTRSRTYDFLLKGLIVCHECGHPLAVLNRKNARGEDRLYFVCRTYQRFTQSGKCTCHAVQESAVTDAVLASLREVCGPYLTAGALLPAAQRAIAESSAQTQRAGDIAALEARIRSLTEHMDQAYLDKLGGVLASADFERVYQRMREERAALEDRLASARRAALSPAPPARLADTLVERFIGGAFGSRELLCDLISRIELTQDRRLILRYRCKAPADRLPLPRSDT